ncbi:hypothetical protein [Roseomonas sp. KE0001]|uniref:hypothetical protein n=1 Tax=Roseomonas sp. KE0001 TaxID=2479201 RepID=UPI0018DF817C|nr:hypothetical protein [Roseomonas sp. KE0001]MBI0434210.1 hypothetical protein [Roseomonas sp. KE0001]
MDDDPLRLFTEDGLTGGPVFGLLRQGRYLRSDTMTAREIAILLGARAGPAGGEPPITYWEAVQREFRAFLCGGDGSYDDLRQALFSARGETQAALVSIIAAAIGAQIGAAATVVAPLVTLLLLVALRIGRQAFCRLRTADAVRPFGRDPESGAP